MMPAQILYSAVLIFSKRKHGVTEKEERLRRSAFLDAPRNRLFLARPCELRVFKHRGRLRYLCLWVE